MAKRAIITVHGMGQQLPFQMINGVCHALGLAPQDVKMEYLARGNPQYRATTTLENGDELHVYEAVWSPFTQNVANYRDVVSFLLRTGLQGILRSGAPLFRRWAFGKTIEYPTPATTGPLLVILAIVVLALLALMAGFFAFVGRFVVGSSSVGLGTLTTLTIDLVPMLLSGALLGLAFWRAPRQFGLLWVLIGVFGLLLLTTTIAFAFHSAGLRNPAQSSPHSWAIVGAVLVLTAAMRSFWKAQAIRPALSPDGNDRTKTATKLLKFASDTWVCALLFFGILSLTVGASAWLHSFNGLYRWFAGYELNQVFLAPVNLVEVVQRIGIGALFIVIWVGFYYGFSALKQFLVDYLGDVAIYITYSEMSRFYEVRQKVKGRVVELAEYVYGKENGYDEVIVLAHSLGTVVAYDMLNILYRSDQLRTGSLSAPERTSLFLTYGSPLDKSMFLFHTKFTQGSVFADMLAGQARPMTQTYDLRPQRWINLWSMNDVVSGPLDLYDDPAEIAIRNPKVVENLELRNLSPLKAHVEFEATATFREILGEFARGQTHWPAAASPAFAVDSSGFSLRPRVPANAPPPV
jgi:hypothetical protein